MTPTLSLVILPLVSISQNFYTDTMGIIMNRSASLERFHQARRQAWVGSITAKLRGQDAKKQLLSFDAIRSQLRQQSPLYQGIHEVPMEQILGSVGRYNEFTRTFLPLNDSLADRWVGVDTLAQKSGWPPIELYKVGNAYFVRDGNHRTSVAKQMGLATIEAHVWEYPDEPAIFPEDTLDDVLIRLGKRAFLDRTHLDELHPDHNIVFTSPGRYTELLAQIYNLQETLSQIDDEPMTDNEAVTAWYEMIYLPIIQIIHESNLLAAFPGRTEADLFVWVSRHRELLREQFGDYMNLSELMQMLVEHYGETTLNKAGRQLLRLIGSDAPASLPELPILEEE